MGAEGVTDVLWLANLCLCLAFVALMLRSPDILGMGMVAAGFPHLSWMYDLFHWLLYDHFRLARGSYIGMLIAV